MLNLTIDDLFSMLEHKQNEFKKLLININEKLEKKDNDGIKPMFAQTKKLSAECHQIQYAIRQKMAKMEDVNIIKN